MNTKSRLCVLSIIALLLISLSVGFVAAYETEKTSPFTLDENGNCIVNEEELGISYEVVGTVGANGSITTTVYEGNPQATAGIPEGIQLSKFIGIAFDMDSDDFMTATITFSYSDTQDIQPPYSIYKYISESDSYVKLLTTVDEEAKTMTIILTNTDDPLFAVGGMGSDNILNNETTVWIAIIVVAIIILFVFLVVWLKSSGKLDF